MAEFTFPATFPYASTMLTVEHLGMSLDVEMRVYDKPDDMRRDATLYYVYEAPGSDDSACRYAKFTEALGVTLPGRVLPREKNQLPDLIESPHVVVFLNRENLTPEIVAHELTHAAMYLNSVYHKRKERIRLTNETVPYMVGSLLAQCEEADIIQFRKEPA